MIFLNRKISHFTTNLNPSNNGTISIQNPLVALDVILPRSKTTTSTTTTLLHLIIHILSASHFLKIKKIYIISRRRRRRYIHRHRIISLIFCVCTANGRRQIDIAKV